MQKLPYLVLGAILIFSGCDTTPEKIARVGSLHISVKEFRSALNARYPHKQHFPDLDPAKKQEILNNLIKQKLRLNAAYDKGLRHDPRIVDLVKDYQEKLILGRYHEKMVIDVIVPAEQVEKYIRNQQYEVNASHILIAYREVNPRVERTEEEARTLADEIHQKLLRGDPFVGLAEQYSDDPGVKSNQGNLSYFTWGTMVPEFEESAWNLDIGEISGPVKSRFGYHLIRLEDKRLREGYSAPEDAEELFYIKRRLFMTHGDSGTVVWEKHLGHLKQRYEFILERQNILGFATLVTQKFYEGVTDYASFDKSQLNMVLAAWRGGALTVDDLLANDLDRLNRLLVRYKQAQFVEEDVEAQGVRRLILADARSIGLEDDEYVRDQVRNFQEKQLLQAIEEEEVAGKTEPTPAAVRDYYASNPDKFLKPAEIELWEIFVESEALAKTLAVRAGKGENFEKLARQYSQDVKYRKQGGYLGFLGSGARGAVTREAFSLGPGNRTGGPLKYRNGWVVFRTGRKKEASLRPFEEVENRAGSLLKRELLNERRTAWEDSLAASYVVEVDSVKLKEI